MKTLNPKKFDAEAVIKHMNTAATMAALVYAAEEADNDLCLAGVYQPGTRND